MRNLIVGLVTLVTAVFTGNSYANNQSELAKHLYTANAPKPAQRVAPQYPRAAAKQRREGWAILNFVIDEQGEVSNILVGENSGSEDITKAAVQAVQKWQYTPAMEDGKPVQQCANSVFLSFKMGDKRTKGLPAKFRRLYKNALQAKSDEDYEELENLLEKMKSNKYQHLSENSYYHLLAADYAKLKGDKHSQVQHLQSVMHSLELLVNEKQKLSVLYQVFDLQIQLKRYNTAYKTYKKLIKLPAAKPYLDELKTTIEKIDGIVASNQSFTYHGNIKDKRYWQLNMSRKEFSLTDVNGELSKLELRCANKHHVYTIKDRSTWKIPAGWDQCRLFVFGEPNASFNVTEHPFSEHSDT
ncbi:energy transducer TonB [Algibacillus agarilyticus]|uniref:energy transducer TonB n=1 Tax=Algibacillus agarilyticus TaxID=2234133 RepID=UPI000DCFCA38|nr:energy transducer TonB [Algibacillus agarilyticus]